MPEQTLKQMAATRALKVGHFIVEFATPGIGQILKAAGCEFVILDTEHSGFGHDTVKSALRYMQAADLPTIVRVPSKDYHHIARAADMGAEGIMLPMVNSADEAKQILSCMKYPPEGLRGAAFQVAHDRYVPGTPLDKMDAANKRTTFVAQIETAAGVKNVDEIAAVKGVDVLWVGHFDLSNSLGIPGEFDNPKFIKATDAIIAAARKHGKAAGRLVPTVEQSIELYDYGFDFICYSGDVWALYGAVSSAVSAIREGCAQLSDRRAAPAKASKKGKRK
jgi:2-keto-3-deoxy-L-rhamnonate aldolase RhmA